MKLAELINDLQWDLSAEGDIETNVTAAELRVLPDGSVYVHFSTEAKR